MLSDASLNLHTIKKYYPTAGEKRLYGALLDDLSHDAEAARYTAALGVRIVGLSDVVMRG